MTRKPALALAFAVVAFLGASRLLSDEGMWMPQQIPQLAPELVKMGLKLDPQKLADLTGDPMGAIVSLGGCSASFVSPQGLILTNHHCVYSYLQFNSTPQKNLIEDGFLANTLADEVPAAPDARVWVTTSIEDVTGQVLPKPTEKLSDLERYRRVERRRKELIRDCEREGGVRCTVPSFFEGSKFWRVKQLEIRDVRLVYAPARAIGNYGGEIDNWMWPRHTGDFGFVRAYVSPDGKPSDFARENVPYRPKHVLKVSTADFDPGDFMMVIGYPGRTFRYELADEVRDAQDFDLPTSIRYRKELIRILEDAGRSNKDVSIRNASRLRGLLNYLKKYEGTIDAFEKGNLIERRRAEEKEVAALVAGDPAAKKRYEAALAEIEKLNALKRKTRERDALLEWISSSSPMLSQANTVWRLAGERPKDDIDRATGFQERDWKRLKAMVTRAQRTIEPGSDRAGLRYFLLETAKLPRDQRIPAVDAALAATGEADPAAAVDAFLDRLYAGTKIADAKERLAMFEESQAQLTARDDAMVELAAALRATMDEKQKRDDEIAGAMMRTRTGYVALLQKLRKGRVYPDANSTLRVTFGQVKGYSPRDSIEYAAQTTLSGVVEKETGKEPFDPPGVLLAASQEKKLGPYVDPELGDVPVDFLTTGDITNGSSGSATLNAKGELTGLAFDGNYEAMGSDFLVNPDVQRAIHVDTRYILWVMDAIDGAHHLIREMGLPVHFSGALAAGRSAR
ncbi:MAG TPA: S46 family peptidase [Thermoanaerobaculia bacterium]|nr:S46 family peptidase [Thermoanaerobaculia bacterium]